jgi:hypothetical protein
VALVNGLQSWNIDQLAAHSNRPDLLLQKLGAKDTSLVSYYAMLHRKRLRRQGMTDDMPTTDAPLPAVMINSYKSDNGICKIKYTFGSSCGVLKSCNIFVNNVPVYGAYGKLLSNAIVQDSDDVPLCKGENKIEISCVDNNKTESLRDAIVVLNDKQTVPDLYVLAFGVSRYKNPAYNLAYADKDVRDLSSVLEGMKDKGFANVYSKVLTNEQVTPEAIKQAKDFVKNAKPDDVFILSIAGHGTHDNDPEATYYFLTYNTDLKNLKGTAADFETIEDLLQGIPPRNKLFLMDACESGEIDDEDQGQMVAMASGAGIASRGIKKNVSSSRVKSQVPSGKRSYLYQKDRYIYNDLVRRSGAIVFSSSKGGELSYERSDIQNGLFTKSIMKALTTKDADKNGDGIVSTDELREYVSADVGKASNDLQHPTVDRDNIYQKFGFSVGK